MNLSVKAMSLLRVALVVLVHLGCVRKWEHGRLISRVHRVDQSRSGSILIVLKDEQALVVCLSSGVPHNVQSVPAHPLTASSCVCAVPIFTCAGVAAFEIEYGH